jgi:nicotinamidase-related amidase
MSEPTLESGQPIGRLEPDRTALLVVDMQRYFLDPEAPFGRFIASVRPDGAGYYQHRVNELVIPQIQRLLKAFRDRKAQVVYTELGSFREDGRDLAGWARRHNDLARQMVGSPIYPSFADESCRVDDRLTPAGQDMILRKTTSGPLNSTRLDQTLRVLGIDTVVVTGVVTDVCVAQTAREFGDRDFDAIIVSDACAAFDERAHDVTMSTIAATFGFVADTNQILQSL